MLRLLISLGALLMSSAFAYAAPLHEDEAGRPVAIGSVNGLGPLLFVIDTGANRAALSESAVRAAALEPTRQVSIVGSTGATASLLFEPGTLALGDTALASPQVLAIPDDHLPGTNGLIGSDMFAGRQLVLDFKDRRYEVRASQTADGGEVLPGRVRNQMLFLSGRIGDVAVTVLPDTGASRVFVNQALIDALGLTPVNRDPRHYVEGVAGEAETETYVLPPIRLGDVVLERVHALRAELAVFRDAPGLAVGIPTWRRFDRVAFDYVRGEAHVWLPGAQ